MGVSLLTPILTTQNLSSLSCFFFSLPKQISTSFQALCAVFFGAVGVGVGVAVCRCHVVVERPHTHTLFFSIVTFLFFFFFFFSSFLACLVIF